MVAMVLPAPCGQPLRSPRPALILGLGEATPPKTISETKSDFRDAFGRPVGPMLQGFVNEMLASNTLAMGNPFFKYDRIYAFGFQALCETFMATSTATEREALQDAMCKALGLDPKRLRRDAQALQEAAASSSSEEALFASADFGAVAQQDNFRYSYPFGAGLLALMPLVDVEPSEEAIERWCGQLNVGAGKLKKDWAFFESAVDKLLEARQMLLEMQAADKRKEAAKLEEQAKKAAEEAKQAEEEAQS